MWFDGGGLMMLKVKRAARLAGHGRVSVSLKARA